MEAIVNSKTLVCVEYPGIIRNEEKMFDTLGGIEAITKVHYNDQSCMVSRLELRFRPEDPYCKPVHGERYKSTDLLLKVTVRRRKKKLEEESSKEQISKVEICGTINSTYKFRNMTDFQFLPFTETEGQKVSLLPSMVPTVNSTSEWLREPCPLFLLPALFARLDTPSNYHFRHLPNRRKPERKVPHAELVGKGRAKRGGLTLYITWEDPTPMVPLQAALECKEIKFFKNLVNQFKEVFEERPLWTRNSLLHRLSCKLNQAKTVLPVVGYYFTAGPWRNIWCRFGYDPRKDPNAIAYQLLDIRINVPAEKGVAFVYKRSQLNNKFNQRLFLNQGKGGVTIKPQSLLEGASPEKTTQRPRVEPVFESGYLPPYRQVFYQLCDIRIPDVQSLVGEHVRLVLDKQKQGLSLECHEKDGFFPSGIIDRLRELVMADIKRTITNIHSEYQSQQGSADKGEEEEREAYYEESDEENQDEEEEEDETMEMD